MSTDKINTKEKSKVLTCRLDSEEWGMLTALRDSPHCINISAYIRASIRHLYNSKTQKKPGRPTDTTTETDA